LEKVAVLLGIMNSVSHQQSVNSYRKCYCFYLCEEHK